MQKNRYLNNLDTKDGAENDWVPDTTLFCLDKDRNILVGAVNIRHRLNEELLKMGGYIGDGVWGFPTIPKNYGET